MLNHNKDKAIILFVEGDTEIEFYKALIACLRKKNNDSFNSCIEYIDVRGVGNYKYNVLRKFNEIKRKHPNNEFYVFLCYDTDVFELAKKPPVNMVEVKNELIDNGAKKVELIRANKSIEDWFLLDFEGVLRYLRLPITTKKEQGKGQDVLKKLFRKANKVYVKGGKTEGFINHLNIEKIKSNICPSINKLCKYLMLDCFKICNKHKP